MLVVSQLTGSQLCDIIYGCGRDRFAHIYILRAQTQLVYLVLDSFLKGIIVMDREATAS